MKIKFIQQIIDILKNKNRGLSQKPIFVFNGKRKIDKSVLIRNGVIIQNPKGTLVSIGKNSQLSPYVVLFGGNISIGKNVMIGPHTTIVVGEHNWQQYEKPMRFADSIKEKDIIIEEDVWIGANCTIVSGAYIHKGAVIGANSFVNKEIPPYAIAAGSPAKVIKYRFDEDTINKLISNNERV